MPEISVTVKLSVQVDGIIDPVVLEARIRAEAMRAGRELYATACAGIDEVLSEHGHLRLEPRWVATTMGRVRVHRWRVGKRGEQSRLPLDEIMCWAGAEASAGLREVGCDLAVRMTYRQAAEILSRFAGDHIAAKTVWEMVQHQGVAIRTTHRVMEEDLLQNGIAPPYEGAAPEMVVIEADGTFLRAQRENTKSLKVRTAVSYHGKEPAGGRTHRRWRLVGKHCYATTASTTQFGKAIAVDGIARYRLNRVRHVLACHDGEDEFGLTFRAWFPNAIHQHDQWHVSMRLWDGVGQDQRRFKTLRQRAFADPVRTADYIRRGFYGVRPSEAADLATYLANARRTCGGSSACQRTFARGACSSVALRWWRSIRICSSAGG